MEKIPPAVHGGRKSALGPARCAGAHRALWLAPRLPAGLVVQGRGFIGSANQGHISSAAWWRLRIRRIQPGRYAK